MVTMEGAELLAKTEMIGTVYTGDGPDFYYGFELSFDDIKIRDSKSIFIANKATASSPSGFKVTFDTKRRLHELTVVPRATSLNR